MLEKTFQPNELESSHYEEWEKSGHFQCKPESDKSPFTVMMPPPNVNGSLHVGHGLVMTLQDVIARYQRMKGKDVLWQPGTDHASIAVDLLVRKELEAEGLTKEDIGREEFLKRCWAQKEKSGGTITKQLRKLGATPDWTRERFTMDDDYMNSVIHMFVKMYKDGLIYRDQRLVNWDPKMQTSISDIEVEHKDVKGSLYHVSYQLEDGTGSISIATTRPETILADGAIAVHPDDEKYKDLVGKNVVVPICNRIIPIIADTYVKMDFGSGAVKITAAHDYNDFEVYKRHKVSAGIPLINLMNPNGTMNENCPEDYVGLDRFEARKKIINDLDELEYLIKVEKHIHQVPYGDRSGVVIEPYLTDQWYCDAPKLGVEATKAVEDGRMEFVPKQWENTYYSWMRNLEPWCISRQLWWGYQIPAYYGPDEKIFVAETLEEAQAEADAHYGEAVELRQDDDILDTWYSSGLWPFATLGWPDKTPELDKYYPGDVLVTGFDIIFFWVARMMMMGLYALDEVPFHKVYINGLVRDASGNKMSKSKGNVMDPLVLSEKYGTDAVRFTMCAMCGQGQDVRLAEQRIEGYRNFSTKLWNAARYCEMNDSLPQEEFDPSSVQQPYNQWIIHSLKQAEEGLTKSLGQYRFNDAANGIYQFVWGTFCDWYLEFTKPIINGDDEAAIAETKATTGWVLEQILLLLNPFMPYITEELHKQIAPASRKDELLLGSSWPEFDDALANDDIAAEIQWAQTVISDIRSIRADMSVPVKAKIDLIVEGANEGTATNLSKYAAQIKQMAKINDISTDATPPKGSLKAVIREATYNLPIADLIDLDQERERLNKEISKLDDNIKKISQQLENKNFVANAPEEIIAEKKGIVIQDEEKKTKILQALEQLNAA